MNLLSTENEWFRNKGSDQDVVISSKIEIHRNLRDFLFPDKLNTEDLERVKSLVIDAFNKVSDNGKYDYVNVDQLDLQSRRILASQGVFLHEDTGKNGLGVFFSGIPGIETVVNNVDHIRITGDAAGLEFSTLYPRLKHIESQLGKNLIFSSSPDIGFHTAFLKNSGTGIVCGLFVQLPGLYMSEMLDRVIRDFLSNGLSIVGNFKQGTTLTDGYIYQIKFNDPESFNDDQAVISKINECAEKLINLERSSLNHIISNQPVFLKDRILKAYYVLSKSLFINYEELLNHLAFARVGIYSGWLKGIKYSDLTSLIFLTTTGQLKFELNILGREKLGLEKELISEVNILDRLRGEKAKSVFQKCKILI